MTQCDIENTAVEGDGTVAKLEKRFPAWWIWVSDTDAWWASRREQLMFADLAAGLVPYLRASGSAELAGLLAEQDRCERGSSQ